MKYIYLFALAFLLQSSIFSQSKVVLGEEEIRKAGCKRIELGVFEFNEPAKKLYQKMGYAEIGRIPNFTFWQGKMWTDIRMEKYI